MARNKLAKLYITQREMAPKTQVSQSNCDHDLYSFKQDDTVYCHMSSMSTDLTINYANFAPLNVLSSIYSSITIHNLGDLNIDLSLSLKVKCDAAV